MANVAFETGPAMKWAIVKYLPLFISKNIHFAQEVNGAGQIDIHHVIKNTAPDAAKLSLYPKRLGLILPFQLTK